MYRKLVLHSMVVCSYVVVHIIQKYATKRKRIHFFKKICDYIELIYLVIFDSFHRITIAFCKPDLEMQVL